MVRLPAGDRSLSNSANARRADPADLPSLHPNRSSVPSFPGAADQDAIFVWSAVHKTAAVSQTT